jgi:hypothetical protein
MDLKKLMIIGGAGVGAYYLYQWWKRQQPSAVAANGVAPVITTPAPTVAEPAPPKVVEPAPAAPPPPSAVAPAPTPAAPTEVQMQDPSYWESVARSVVAEMGLGALPPWPGIGPVPPTYLGPVWSTVSPVT